MDDNRVNFRLRIDPLVESTPKEYLGHEMSDADYNADHNDVNTIRAKMESHIFHIGKTQDKALDFMENRKAGWIHGVSPPHTVFKYQKLPIGNPKNIFNKSEQEKIFCPHAVFEEVDHASLNRNVQSISSESSNHSEHFAETEVDILNTGEGMNYFSGFYSLPKTTLNVPNSFLLDRHRKKLVSELPEICYQNHVDLGDLTYTFGGMYVSKHCDFRHLGMPIDVDPSKISIYFPCELPPHVDKDILISPYMMQNPHLIIFNSLRSSVSYCDTYSSSSYPSHLNNATGCTISNTHIFFYGGFEITVEKADYLPDIDRWVIQKSLKMNEHGYILDVKTMKFTKIILEPKTKDLLGIGRLGNAICANILDYYEQDTEKQNRCILPCVFADIDNGPEISSPSIKPISSPDSNRYEKFKNSESSNISSRISESVSNEKYYTSDIESTVPQSATSSYSFNILKQLNSLKSVAEQLTTSKLTPSTSSKSSSTHSGPLSSTAPKITHALSKSSRIFHRHQKQPSGGAPKASSSHPLKNTYSNQVRDNRSNSQNSRPVSPVLVGSTLSKSNSHKVPTSVNINGDPKLNIQEEKNKDIVIDTELKPTTTLVSYTSGNSPNKIDFTPKLDGGLKNLENENGFSFDSRSKNASFINSHSSKSVQPQVVSIFIFGGFKCYEDENGFQTFKATNELLRIDIPCKKIRHATHFENEAAILLVGSNGAYTRNGETTHSEVWPSPRGYFANCLIDNAHCMTDKCIWDVKSIGTQQAETGDLVEELFGSKCSRVSSPVSMTDTISSSSTSLQTASSKGSIITKALKLGTPDEYFDNKALLVHGGCNEEFETFNDIYLFEFESGKWQTLSTYVYDYYDSHKQPYEDDDSSIFVKENEVSDPKLVDAELRSCHHTALYYKDGGKDYVFFLGGFSNDYLRYFDSVPYESNKFDVSRLCKLQFAPKNTNTLRVMVLNLQTQTWTFLRYYYEMNQVTRDDFLATLQSNPGWVNARINNFGGCISLNGKSITICHGMANATPEKREDLAKLKMDMPDASILWGAHVRITFPSL